MESSAALLTVNEELQALRARVRDIEEEADKLRQLQDAVPLPDSTRIPTIEERVEMDRRSIYVGNVDYNATAEELEELFHRCGTINRVSILCNEDGSPRGFAYIEFSENESVTNALALDGTILRDREIRIRKKRTNLPGLSSTYRSPHGGPRYYQGSSRGTGRVLGGQERGDGDLPGVSRRDSSSSSGAIRTPARNNFANFSPY